MRQENIIFPLDIKHNIHIAEAWESFTENGDIISSNALRKVISQSWVKSRELGIRPETERAPTVITSDEIEEKIRNEDMGRVGISVLDELSDILKDTQHVVVLADSRGQIFYSVGHRQVQDKLDEINFRPGGAWSEQSVGPNGVGTPLNLGRPEIVMGYEHYCQGWHPWVCYGAPIYDLTGKTILGSVDITGPVKNFNREVMALSMSVAKSIQSGLSILQFHRRDLLREIGKEKLQRWPSDGVMILDENGFIVEYNTKSIKCLNLDALGFLNKPLSQLIPSIAESVQKSYRQKKQIEINIHMDSQSEILQPVNVRIEPILKGDKCLGTALVLIETNKVARPKELQETAQLITDNLRSISDALIKRTLKQNNNNISKAARVLGINRTTIYRRRRYW